MKKIPNFKIILVALISLILYSCQNKQTIPIQIDNHTTIPNEKFESLHCCDYFEEDYPTEHIRVQRIDQAAKLIKDKDGNGNFVRLTLNPVNSDSVIFGIQLFRIDGLGDTLRIGNFGTRTVSKDNVESIQRTTCLFVNK